MVLSDSDITRISCNFWNSKTSNYDGVDVRTNHNDLDFDLYRYYEYPPQEMAHCDENIVINSVVVTKSIRSIIQTNVQGYSRYRPQQQVSTGAAQMIRDKGQLTNILYEGAYEVHNGTIYTSNGDYSSSGEHKESINRMEQLDRVKFQGTPNYSAKDKAQIINDRQRIHNYDRIPFLSNNYFTNLKTVVNPMMPQIPKEDGTLEDQRRSVWSSNGMLFVLDVDLGVICLDSYGNRM